MLDDMLIHPAVLRAERSIDDCVRLQ